MFDPDDFYLTASVGSQYGGSRPRTRPFVRRVGRYFPAVPRWAWGSSSFFRPLRQGFGGQEGGSAVAPVGAPARLVRVP